MRRYGQAPSTALGRDADALVYDAARLVQLRDLRKSDVEAAHAQQKELRAEEAALWKRHVEAQAKVQDLNDQAMNVGYQAIRVVQVAEQARVEAATLATELMQEGAGVLAELRPDREPVPPPRMAIAMEKCFHESVRTAGETFPVPHNFEFSDVVREVPDDAGELEALIAEATKPQAPLDQSAILEQVARRRTRAGQLAEERIDV